MKIERLDFLLEKAGEAFSDGRSPFDHSFLVEHNVTLTEAYDLSKSIAASIAFFQLMLSASKARVDLKKAAKSGKLPWNV